MFISSPNPTTPVNTPKKPKYPAHLSMIFFWFVLTGLYFGLSLNGFVIPDAQTECRDNGQSIGHTGNNRGILIDVHGAITDPQVLQQYDEAIIKRCNWRWIGGIIGLFVPIGPTNLVLTMLFFPIIFLFVLIGDFIIRKISGGQQLSPRLKIAYNLLYLLLLTMAVDFATLQHWASLDVLTGTMRAMSY